MVLLLILEVLGAEFGEDGVDFRGIGPFGIGAMSGSFPTTIRKATTA